MHLKRAWVSGHVHIAAKLKINDNNLNEMIAIRKPTNNKH